MHPLRSVLGVRQQLDVLSPQLGGEGVAEHIDAGTVAWRAGFHVVDTSYAPTYSSTYEPALPSALTAATAIAGSLPIRT
jgi:hypothetical protein